MQSIIIWNTSRNTFHWGHFWELGSTSAWAPWKVYCDTHSLHYHMVRFKCESHKDNLGWTLVQQSGLDTSRPSHCSSTDWFLKLFYDDNYFLLLVWVLFSWGEGKEKRETTKHWFGQATKLLSDNVPDYIKSPAFIWWDIIWHCSILWNTHSAEYDI